MKLKHVVLYAKGHYSRSEDLISDLVKCFKADNFVIAFTPISQRDQIASLFLDYLLELYVFTDSKKAWRSFMDEISPTGCWQIGYYTKSYPLWFVEDEVITEDYDFNLAVIKVALNHINKLTYLTLGVQFEQEPDANVLPLNTNP